MIRQAWFDMTDEPSALAAYKLVNHILWQFVFSYDGKVWVPDTRCKPRNKRLKIAFLNPPLLGLWDPEERPVSASLRLEIRPRPKRGLQWRRRTFFLQTKIFLFRHQWFSGRIIFRIPFLNKDRFKDLALSKVFQILWTFSPSCDSEFCEKYLLLLKMESIIHFDQFFSIYRHFCDTWHLWQTWTFVTAFVLKIFNLSKSQNLARGHNDFIYFVIVMIILLLCFFVIRNTQYRWPVLKLCTYTIWNSK